MNILFEYYPRGTSLAQALIRHSEQVRDKALAVADRVSHLHPDHQFIAEAAMLHDIGIYRTSTAKLGCRGTAPYICHGVIGRQILEHHGLTNHALVCERHVGVGISQHDIQAQGLPLPNRDMLPTTLEEIIICYADKFFSKSNGGTVHSLSAVINDIKPFGDEKVKRFMHWHRLFEG